MPIFERFVHYAWAEKALEMSIQGVVPSQLRGWLTSQGLSDESARRTANILTRMWFPQEKYTQFLKEEALTQYPKIALSEHLVLQWGMALSVFPSFRETVHIIGRLLRLQGEFRKKEVIARVLEGYGNQSTIQRAVERTIQTLEDWEIVTQEGPVFRGKSPLEISQADLAAWLYACLLSVAPERYVPITDLIRSPELFSFEVTHPMRAISSHRYFSVHRDSSDQEIVGVRDEIFCRI